MAESNTPTLGMVGPTQKAEQEIVPVLQSYLREAQDARKMGLNPRDEKWEECLHLYWNRYDHSGKASWQAAENLPEVPAFVDRFAAALKEALVTGPTGFYTVVDPADTEGDLTDAIKRMTDVWLSISGFNQTGTPLGFPAVFEEQCKMGALMASCATVSWADDLPHGYGRVKIETTDPRKVWLDHTGRNLYRVRRVELDKHTLRDMAMQKDRRGKAIWNLDAIDRLVGSFVDAETRRRNEELTGTGQDQRSTRVPIVMDEYIGTVISNDGKIVAKDALMVVANEQYLIRGPESNPFWHKKDWMVFAPLVTAPLSVYGRSYMEDFGAVAGVFNNLTNLILDAVQTSTMKAFAVVPEMLSDPNQLNTGITPNKMFFLEGGNDPKQFILPIELGSMPAEAIQVWQSMKNELREAADINEVGLGQFAPKGRTSATEVSSTQESSSAIIRSVAQTIEARLLNPLLDLVWQTGLQHARADDTMLGNACGPELYQALIGRRRELIQRPITFQARGISTLIQKSRMLKSLLQVMGFLSQSPELLAAFMQRVDMEKFVNLLFNLSDVDISKVTISQRQRMVSNVAQQIQQGTEALTAGQSPGSEAQSQAGDVAKTLGVQR